MKKLKDALLKAKSLALKMKLGQKLGTFCLAAVIAATSLVSAFPMTASAATTTLNKHSVFPGTSGWGFDFRGSGLQVYNPTPGSVGSYYSIDSYYDTAYGWEYYTTSSGNYAYCVQIGKEAENGSHTNYDFEVLYPNSAHRRRMQAAVIYSYKGTPRYGYSDKVELVASQCLIWIISGNLDISGTWASGTSSALSSEEQIFFNCIKNTGSSKQDIIACYKKMRQDVMSHFTLDFINCR